MKLQQNKKGLSRDFHVTTVNIATALSLANSPGLCECVYVVCVPVPTL